MDHYTTNPNDVPLRIAIRKNTAAGQLRAAKRLAEKRVNRHQRAVQKKAAARRLHPGGRTNVIVTKAVVKNHRYLRDHGLPFSKSVADVFIGR